MSVISLKPEVKEQLDNIKLCKGESYNDVVLRIIEIKKFKMLHIELFAGEPIKVWADNEPALVLGKDYEVHAMNGEKKANGTEPPLGVPEEY